MSDVQANVIITGNADGAVSALNAVKNGLANVNQGGASANLTLGTLGRWFTEGAIVTGVLGFAKAAVQAAAGVEQVGNRARVVFGDDFAKVEAETDKLAASVHRNSTELLDYESKLALIAQGLGIGSAQSEQMGESLTK